MGYLSLYRKWRPKGFDDLTGQATVVKTLKNAMLINRIAHAYLFCGPRGTGKTSTAKVFAKALNCANRVGTEPCNQCFSCEQINSGRSVDVIEIDAASNRRIDEIRDLREKVKFSPSEGEYKVYIIDEVHMLTKEAFNALLKTLEEPPANVVFILATTEPHKVLPTIISRCQRFDFGLLTIRELKERLKYICDQEGVVVADEALNLIARTAEGGMRDAISILDQAISFGGNQVVADDVNSILGKVEQRVLSELVDVMAAHDTRGALELVNEIVDQGKDMNQFVKDLLFHFRDLMLLKECGLQNMLTDLPTELKDELGAQAGKFTSNDLLRVLELLSETDQQLKFTSQPRLALEMLMIKLTTKEVDTSLTNLIHRLARLEELVEHGGITMSVERVRSVESAADVPWSDEPPIKGVKGGQRVEPAPDRGAWTGIDRPTSPFGEEVAGPSGTSTRGEVKVEASGDSDHSTVMGTDAGVIPKPTVTDSPVSGVNAGNAMEHGVPSISMEEMENYWNVTMGLLQKSAETRKLRAFLLVAKPYRILGDTLYIVYPASSTFHKSHAETELGLLERALKKVTGFNLKAHCIFEGEEPRLQQAAAVEASEVDDVAARVTPSASREDVHEDPIVQKALKIFGGKVIQVENE